MKLLSSNKYVLTTIFSADNLVVYSILPQRKRLNIVEIKQTYNLEDSILRISNSDIKTLISDSFRLSEMRVFALICSGKKC